MVRKGSLSILASLSAVLLLSGCNGFKPPDDSIPPRPSPAIFGKLPSTPHLGVLVIGDWGTGGAGQRQVAQAIETTHGKSPPDFVLSVGDNIYPQGVMSHRDLLWGHVFEGVYKGPFWDSLTFYPTLGNHDYMGLPGAQVRYSWISPRWKMADRYYSVEKSLPGAGSVLFLAVDTDPIARNAEDSSTQRKWALSEMGRSSADWNVVFGHHPVASGGMHRPDKDVKKAFLPLLSEGVALYVAGHNHTTELLETGTGALQAVCGGGGGLDNPYRVRVRPETLAAFTNGGWCYLRIWPQTLVVELYDRSGGLQHRHFIQHRTRRLPSGIRDN